MQPENGNGARHGAVPPSKQLSPRSVAPRIRVDKRQVYADVTIDLWPCDYDLNERGIEACTTILVDYARRHGGKRRPSLSGSYTSVSALSVPKEDADGLLERLLAEVLDERNQQPLRDEDGSHIRVAERRVLGGRVS